jgi:hypothetical protein
VTQKVCDRAAGQEPGAELGIRHRASRLPAEAMRQNGAVVPFAQYEE